MSTEPGRFIEAEAPRFYRPFGDYSSRSSPNEVRESPVQSHSYYRHNEETTHRPGTLARLSNPDWQMQTSNNKKPVRFGAAGLQTTTKRLPPLSEVAATQLNHCKRQSKVPGPAKEDALWVKQVFREFMFKIPKQLSNKTSTGTHQGCYSNAVHLFPWSRNDEKPNFTEN